MAHAEGTVDKFWITDFDCDDGTYAGPIVIADCRDLAEALIQTCILGPNGERLHLVGELVEQHPVDDVGCPIEMIRGLRA